MNENIIKFIDKLNISYDTENDHILFNGTNASEYDIKIICDRIKKLYNIEITKEDFINIIKDPNNIKISNNIQETKDMFDIIDADNNINESEWEQFLKWKNEDALWKTDKDGFKTSLIECLQNIIGFFNNFPKYKDKIYFNKIRNYAEYNGKQITDAEIHNFIIDLNKYMLPYYSSVKGVRDAIMTIAYSKEINMIKIWMEDNFKKYYDPNNDYIDILLKDIFRCEDLNKFYDLYYAELKLHLIASLKKMCYAKTEADYKYDNILVLCSIQGGTGKTSFCEYLYTFDNICYTNIWEPESVNFNNKDFLEQIHDSACNVFDEVSTKRSVFNSVKSFISKKNDKFRKSYGYVAANNMRKFVLWGTSNNNDFLKDYTTGLERRWMLIHISEDKMNGVYLKDKVTKDNYLFVRRLWAQVMHMHNENKDFELYLKHEWDDKLTILQREYKASNNEDYDTIINDLLEREYGFYDKEYVDIDLIVNQYKYGDSLSYCVSYDKEIEKKVSLYNEGKYILKPEDRPIKYWGKIDRIQKTVLYEILNKLNIEYTKPTLAGEMKTSGLWNGYDNRPCMIGNKTTMAYWRKNKVSRSERKLNFFAHDSEIPF